MGPASAVQRTRNMTKRNCMSKSSCTGGAIPEASGQVKSISKKNTRAFGAGGGWGKASMERGTIHRHGNLCHRPARSAAYQSHPGEGGDRLVRVNSLLACLGAERRKPPPRILRPGCRRAVSVPAPSCQSNRRLVLRHRAIGMPNSQFRTVSAKHRDLQ